MQKAHDAQLNDYWQNLPSIDTPIVAGQLNRIEQTLDTIDDRVVGYDTDKANQSDMLLAIKDVTFDSATGTFTITYFNNTTATINTDIEKIPVNFDYDDDPESAHYQQLIIELDDGTYKYIDMSARVTEYDFASTATIAATVMSGIVSMNIVDGSVTDQKIQPHYLADVTAQASASANAATAASGSRVDAEAWAVGTRNGTPVQMGDPTFQNNSKYYAEHGTGTSFQGLSDTDFQNLENGQVAVYDSATTKWVNTSPEMGMTARIVINADVGSTVSVTTPSGETITPTSVSTTVWRADVDEYGIYTVTAISGGTTRTEYVTIDTVKVYTVTISGQASITFTTGIPSGLSVVVGAQSITTFPSTVALAPGEYTVNYAYSVGDVIYASWSELVELSANESKTIDVVLKGTAGLPNDVGMWLYCGEIYDKNYTTVSQVVADSTTLNALIASNNASDYLKRSTSFSSDICASSVAMTAIGLNNYCSDALLSDLTWLAAICGSTYFESVLNAKVPTMTSNNTPSGICSASTTYSTYYAFEAFNQSAASGWVGNISTANNATSSEAWIEYEFTDSVKVYKVDIQTQSYGLTQEYAVKSYADSEWHTETSGGTLSVSDSFNFMPSHISKKWRFYTRQKNTYGSTLAFPRILILQFYGREDV